MAALAPGSGIDLRVIITSEGQVHGFHKVIDEVNPWTQTQWIERQTTTHYGIPSVQQVLLFCAELRIHKRANGITKGILSATAYSICNFLEPLLNRVALRERSDAPPRILRSLTTGRIRGKTDVETAWKIPENAQHRPGASERQVLAVRSLDEDVHKFDKQLP